MFDCLGAPWQVHACWEEHCSQRRFSASSIRWRFDVNYSDYTTDHPIKQRIVAPETPKSLGIHISGYIRDNLVLRKSSNPIRLMPEATTKREELQIRIFRPTSWFEIEVVTSDGVLYPFLVTRSKAERLRNGYMVSVAGQWIKWHNHWYLLATSIEIVENPYGTKEQIKVIELDAVLKCYYCGRRINDSVDWGIDNVLRVKCARCSRNH